MKKSRFLGLKYFGALVWLAGVGNVAAWAQPAPPPMVVVPPPAPAITPPPAPVAVAPAPGLAITLAVPDTYVWDGYEYVGAVGGQYYYLGPGEVWMVMSPDRLMRFHNWEQSHHDWRAHAVRNSLYRRDAYGHDHSWNRDRDDHRNNFDQRDRR